MMSIISVMDVNYFERKCKECKDLTITEIMSENNFLGTLKKTP